MAHPQNNFSIHKFMGKRKTKKTVDKMTYVVGIGGNLAVVPQIINAWKSKAPGMAIATWILFLGMGVIWLIYAIQHRQKPLIIAQLVGLTCSFLVVLGWAVNNYLR